MHKQSLPQQQTSPGPSADVLLLSTNTKKTPTKRPKEVDPSSDSSAEEVNKQKPPEKNNDAIPTAMFQNRVDTAKGGKPGAKKK